MISSMADDGLGLTDPPAFLPLAAARGPLGG